MKRIFYILFALIGLPLVAQAADGSAVNDERMLQIAKIMKR